MRPIMMLCCGAVAALTMAPLSASPETRQSYLSRLSAICENGCLQPRELLRTARKRKSDDAGEIAGIIDITAVSRSNFKFLLHQDTPSLFDMNEFDFGMPQLDQTPIENVNAITIELDEQTALDLLNLSASAPLPDVSTSGDAGIIVEGDRDRKAVKPSVEALENMFRNRRIVVRGTPRLDIGFIGARRDRRQKKLTIIVDNSDDLVLLPRYDDDGNPILDGPLAGLGAH